MITAPIDESHDRSLLSWVDSANAEGCDFPIQNLPFGRFQDDGAQDWRLGIAIGDQVLDLGCAGLVPHADMNELMRSGPSERVRLRRALSSGLRLGSDCKENWRHALRPLAAVKLGLPCQIGDYTDFYVGIHHAAAVGSLFRPDEPLLPNYKWLPIGYHGRASTIVVSGTPIRRPKGQVKRAGAASPELLPTERLDFELELGVVIGNSNIMGEPVPVGQAEQYIFGLTLFNDWSARDIQSWEYRPLGPFLSKNFASTISPWIVTLEALAPFRRAPGRPDGDELTLAYLECEEDAKHGAIDIQLEVSLQTRAMRHRGELPEVISRSNYADAAYWTASQMVAHHTINGCAVKEGDLMGTGTLSGSTPASAGSLLEISRDGRESFCVGGEQRRYLEDGDRVSFAGHCERDGFRRIGFGACEGTVDSR